MANTAEVIKFPGPEPGQEKKLADLEDGYTRTANELLESVMLSGLTQHQLLIVMAVWRKTYGYNKKMDWIGNEQFRELTGMAATKCSTAKNELIRMGVLIQKGRLVGMNKAISEWKTKVNGFGKTFTDSVKKTFPKSVKSDLPNRSNTKDNITKDNKDINTPIVPKAKKSPKAFDPLNTEIPEWLPSGDWLSWVQYRREIKKPIKSKQTVTQAINILSSCRDMGFPPAEIINRSIGNGWTGLFIPKDARRAAATSRPAESFASKEYGKTEIPTWAME
ncbi:replication protein [Lonsdalea quercina]|uniref:replication protein n=1 Tax=Lonsdalea quercina TaxID=71657 RepID=UPI0039757AA6